jgi:hypothetical protein
LAASLPTRQIRWQRRLSGGKPHQQTHDHQQQNRDAQGFVQVNQPFMPLGHRSHHAGADEQHGDDHQRHQPVQQPRQARNGSVGCSLLGLLFGGG